MGKKYSILPSELFSDDRSEFAKQRTRKRATKCCSCIVLMSLLFIPIYMEILQEPITKVEETQGMSIDSFKVQYPSTLQIILRINDNSEVSSTFDGDVIIDNSTTHILFEFSENTHVITISCNFSNYIGLGINILIQGRLHKEYIGKEYISSNEDILIDDEIIIETSQYASYYSHAVDGDNFKIRFSYSITSPLNGYRDNIRCVGDIYIDVEQSEIDTGVFGDLEAGMNKITHINQSLAYSRLLNYYTDYIYDTTSTEIPDVYGVLIEYRIYGQSYESINAPDPNILFTNFTLYLDNGEHIDLKDSECEVEVI